MSNDGQQQDAARVAAVVWRMESGRIVAALARILQDVGTAEDVAQDAMVSALEHWPRDGVPPNPAGWLMTTARNRAIDLMRRRAADQRALERHGSQDVVEPRQESAAQLDRLDDWVGDGDGDDLLRLVLTACHPMLAPPARVALVLRCLGGLSTGEIARAFLIPEVTAAQRIVRAKRTLAEQHAGFDLPAPAQLRQRLGSVLEVIYLIFNEGYAATAGEEWMRPDLTGGAIRLGRVLAGLLPGEPEVLGLLALMELQASRQAARTGPGGVPVLLEDQDRRRWDRLLIRRGLAGLARAEALASDPSGDAAAGPYTVQAAIGACHARAHRAEDTDWARITKLYDVLGQIWPSPVVQLNRAVAVGMSVGPMAGLAVVDAPAVAASLARYPQLPAVRGDLLARAGHPEEAAAEFRRAAGLTANDRERALYLGRADRLLS